MNKRRIKILHYETDENFQVKFNQVLSQNNFDTEILTVKKQSEYIAQIVKQQYDIIFADFDLITEENLSPLHITKKEIPDVPIIVTGDEFPLEGRELIRSGVTDFILKSDVKKLPWVIHKSLAYIDLNTSRKLTELSLRESEDFIYSTFDALFQKILVLDMDGTIVFVNKAWWQFVNKFKVIDCINGDNFFDCCGNSHGLWNDGASLAEGIRAVLAHDIHEFSLENSIRTHDGNFWFSIRVTPFNGGNSTGAVVALEDITDRKQVERELHARNLQYETFIKNSMVGIWKIEFPEPISLSLPPEKVANRILSTGYFSESNPEFAKMYGLNTDAISNRQLKKLVVDWDKSVERLTQMIKNGLRLYAVENGEKDKNGNIRFFRNSYFGYEENNFLQWIWGVQFDITDRKLTEIELEKRNSILESVGLAAEKFMKANRLNGNFQEILNYIGEASQSSRAYVFKNHEDENGNNFTSQIYEWTADGIPPQIDNGCLQNIPWKESGMERWMKLLQKGNIVSGHVKDFPESEQEILAPQGIKSVLAVPIFIHNQWWGFMGFDDCRSEREWSEAEVSALKIAANIISAALIKSQFETELAHSNKLYKSLMKTSPDPVIVTELDGTVIEVSEKTMELYGSNNSGEIIGRNAFELIVPEERERAQQNIQNLLAGKVNSNKRFTCLKADGTNFISEINSAILNDSKGQPQYLISNLRDITDQVMAEEKMLEQAALLHEVQDAIILLDSQGNIVLWNHSAEKIYGWKSAEVVGKKFESIISEEDSTDFAKINQAFSEVQKSNHWEDEITNHTRSGKKIHVMSRWTVVKDDQDMLKTILIVNTDITEKKKLETQFLRAQRLESIGALAGGIAHDLNNLLSPIMIAVQMLKMQNNGNRMNAKYLEAIDSSAKRGAEMVSQVLTFGRGIEGEKVLMQPRHIIKETYKILKETFPKSIDIQVNTPKDLWNVKSDPTQLHQVFMNLCVNARDAMPNGGQLKVSAANVRLDEQYSKMALDARTGPYVLISVADTGSGIPRENMDKIFDPFFTTKELDEGTGLGLSTVQAIVKNHGGFIKVYSEENQGTEFKIYLEASKNNETAQDKNVESKLDYGNGETILVVDDEASIREIIKETLELYNYRVLTAENGTDAISIYVQHRDEIDAVITDMVMPVMDGKTTIQALKKIESEVKILAISGFSDYLSLHRLRDMGVHHFISKPFTAAKLLQNVQEIFAEKGKEELSESTF